MNNPRTRAVLPSHPSSQRGVVLFIALVVLVAMTLAGIALTRAVGTNVLVAGNLAFRSSALKGADAGLEAGRAWLKLQNDDVLNFNQAQGYVSHWDQNFKPEAFDWAGQGQLVGTDSAGNEIRYVVHRMCELADAGVNHSDQQCVTRSTAGASGNKGVASYGISPMKSTERPYFRITARALGPRNTVSYVQSIMY